MALALPYRNTGTEGFGTLRAAPGSGLQDVFSGAVGWCLGLGNLQTQGNDDIPVPDPSLIRVATLDGPFTALHFRALHCPRGLPARCHSHGRCWRGGGQEKGTRILCWLSSIVLMGRITRGLPSCRAVEPSQVPRRASHTASRLAESGGSPFLNTC